MNIAEIQKASADIVRLLADYKNAPSEKREMRLDPVIYGYFEAYFGNMSRQHYVKMHSKPKPQRIDFRHGGNNPTVFEFVVRTADSKGTLYGSQNWSELRKLTRVVPSKARTRVLLLLDLAKHPISKENLKATYDPIHAGKGRFKRHSVRVIYVHESHSYHFLWKPDRQYLGEKQQ